MCVRYACLKHFQPLINQTHTWQLTWQLHLSANFPFTCLISSNAHTLDIQQKSLCFWYHPRLPKKPGCVTQPDYAPPSYYPASPSVSGYPVQLWPVRSWIFHSVYIMHVRSHMITSIIFWKTIRALMEKLPLRVRLMEEKILHRPHVGKVDISDLD